MKIFLLIIIVCLFYHTGYSQTSKKILIQNVNLIPFTKSKETILYHYDVIISGSKILSIKPTRKINNGKYHIINGTDKFIIPGMADMHVHLPTSKSAFSSKKFHYLNLVNGITTVRQMRGSYDNLKTRDSIKNNFMMGCHTYISCPPYKNTDVFNAQSCEDSLQAYKKQGFDFVKYLYGLSKNQYDTLASIAKKLHYKLTGHIPGHDLIHAVDVGQSSIEHIEPFINLYKKDSLAFWNTINKMSEKHLFACPDLQLYIAEGAHVKLADKFSFYGLDQLSQYQRAILQTDIIKFYSDQYNRNPLEFANTIIEESNNVILFKKLLKGIHQKGVPLLISAGEGNFVVPGFSFIDELKLFVEAGISPYETLRCATINAADFFDEEHLWGSVEENKRADLILLNKNPLVNIDNIKSIEGVFINGLYQNKAELLELIKIQDYDAEK